MMNFRQKNGFTLIELIVVMFLLGTMFSFLMPRFQDAIETDKTNKFSRWLMLKGQALKESALSGKMRYTLHIGMDSGTLWVSNESMTEDAILELEESGYKLPEDLRVLDVEYPEKGIVSMGRADICFYKNGYSDKVLIHIEDDEGNQRTFLIEPFLSKIKRYEEYVGFEG